MTPAEMFMRMRYLARAHLRLTEEEYLYSDMRDISNLIEIHLQYNGVKKPYREKSIDDILRF